MGPSFQKVSGSKYLDELQGHIHDNLQLVAVEAIVFRGFQAAHSWAYLCLPAPTASPGVQSQQRCA